MGVGLLKIRVAMKETHAVKLLIRLLQYREEGLVANDVDTEVQQS